MDTKNEQDFSYSNFPEIPSDQIPRDSLVRHIAQRFGPECKEQLVVGPPQTGKTNFLAQFANEYKEHTICYFITQSPLTQELYSFLYSLCFQACKILGKEPPEYVGLEMLKSYFMQLCNQLQHRAKSQQKPYYILIDSIERGMEGRDSNRIIDIFPLQTFPYSPYLLLSCQSDKVNIIKDKNGSCYEIEPGTWAFQRNDTREYFKELSLQADTVDKIQHKYNGIPGYLKLVKNALSNDPNLPLETIPMDLSKLFSNDVEYVLSNSDEQTIEALKLLSISPLPPLVKVLAISTNTDPDSIVERLKQTRLVSYDSEKQRLQFINEYIQEVVIETIASERKKPLLELLLKTVIAEAPNDVMYDSLLIKLDDYEGLRNRLNENAIIESLQNPVNGISGLIKRLNSTAEMAVSHNDTSGMIKLSLAMITVKAFIAHSMDEREIRALIAIGDNESAISHAYALSEMTSKIRLVARTFSSIKEKEGSLPSDARETLKTMAESLKIEEMDKDVAQEIAVDLFSILPDTTIAILEKVMGKVEKQGILETAIEAVSESQKKQVDENLLNIFKEKGNILYFTHILNKWLADTPFSKLSEELNALKNTKAKEYILRQWCRKNPNSTDLIIAINTWQDIVISDREFTLPLQSLRHISALITTLPIDNRKNLIEILKIPEFISIETPREEWVRFRLNLIEALFDIAPECAKSEIEDIHDIVLERIKDLDTKSFCLVRLLLTVKKILPNEKDLINLLHVEFQQAFHALGNSSADQLEITRGIINTLTEIDPDDAFIVATELNTRTRRNKAVQLVLQNALRKRGKTSLSKLIRDCLNYISDTNDYIRDMVLIDAIFELIAQDYALDKDNLQTLKEYANGIEDATLKSEALGGLAVLFKNSNMDPTELTQQSIESWHKEGDLKIKFFWGYQLVEHLSKINVELAKIFFKEVSDLHLLPGASIAAGRLGAAFGETIDLAIRSLNPKDFIDDREPHYNIMNLIEKVPAINARVNFYSCLAASSYRNNNKNIGDEIVRTKILPQFQKQLTGINRCAMLSASLPVIFEYSQDIGLELMEKVPEPESSKYWHSTVLWSLCKSHLGDQDSIKVHNLRLACDYKTFKEIVFAATQQIKEDTIFCSAVDAINSALRASLQADKIDPGQAFDLLRILDEITTKTLPDINNIKHDGYLIFTQAIIHGTRSIVFRSMERRGIHRGIKKEDIRKGWETLQSRANKIPNEADRVFVLAEIAKQMRHYHANDPRPSKEILRQIETDTESIPDIVDKIDRFEMIARAWGDLNESSKAGVVFKKLIELVSKLNKTSGDDRLSSIVQAAYKINPTLAEKIVQECDQVRRPNELYNPTSIAFQVEKLVANPFNLTLKGTQREKELILTLSSDELTQGLVANLDIPRQREVVEKWLFEGMQYAPGTGFNIIHWATENLHRKTDYAKYHSMVDVFINMADLIHKLANIVSHAAEPAIPSSMRDSYPLLNEKIISFNVGDTDRAKEWLRTWLSNNVTNYLKICDPYFGHDELEYLKYVPPDCKIIIITTNKYLKNGSDKLRNELISYWREMTQQTMPSINLFIVPKMSEDRFHDRVMITSHAGLSIGQSLNGLGKSRGNIIILTDEEAETLEKNYISDMLNAGTWVIDHNVQPVTFKLND